MKTKSDYMDYGIYIDRKRAFIVSLNHMANEVFLDEVSEENKETTPPGKKINTQEHIQNKSREELKKFCKSIVEKVVNANNILVFGPSTNKYDLQNEIRNTKRLKNINEQIIAADAMDKDTAVRFVRDYYTPVGQQSFTERR